MVKSSEVVRKNEVLARDCCYSGRMIRCFLKYNFSAGAVFLTLKAGLSPSNKIVQYTNLAGNFWTSRQTGHASYIQYTPLLFCVSLIF